METYSPTTTTTISSPLLLSYHGFFQQQKQNVTRAHKTLPNKPPCSCNLMDLHHPAGVTSTSPPLSMMKPLEDLTNFEIEDLLDFPTEEEGEDGDGDGEEEDGGEEAPPHSFVSELNSKSRNCAGIKSSKLQEEGLSIPPDELVDELEWLSTFNEDNSYSGDTQLASFVSSEGHAPTYNTKSTSTPLRDTYMRSPVSVLEQIGHHHFSYIGTHLENPKRSRKARSRGRIWSRDILKPIPMNKSVSQDNTMCSTASNDDDTFNTSSVLQQWETIGRPSLKKKPKKARLTCVDIEDIDSTIAVQRCSHCLVHKTPQWRAGPLGPKTLCNACGVRFKSGRLLPEYRPACSPTFVSHVHSNSHRRILEMRRAREELGSQCNNNAEIAHEDDCNSWNGSWKAASPSQDMSLLRSSKDLSQEAEWKTQEMEFEKCTGEFNANHILIRVLDKKSMYKKGSIIDKEEEEVTMSWDGPHVNETPQAIHKKGHVIHDSIERER